MTRVILLTLCLAGLPGCAELAISMVGASVGAALRYNIDGVTYRTFTWPAAQVKEASLTALERMGIVLDATSEYEHGELIHAIAENRYIQIEIEPISKRAARIRIAAKNGSFFYDTATAQEIVAQTERLLQSAAAGN